MPVFTGTTGNDTLVGGSVADTLNGLAGDDTLRGQGGDDLMLGGTGRDEFVGGPGNDTFDGGADTRTDIVFYESESGDLAVFANLSDTAVTVGANTQAARTARDTFGNTDSFINIEGVTGNSGNDTLVGNELDNFFRGMQGTDIIQGGLGFDEMTFQPILTSANATPAGIVVVFSGNGNGTVTNDGYGFTDTFTSIERIRGSMKDDLVTGDSSDNSFRGLGGNDTFNAGLGFDQLDYAVDEDVVFLTSSAVTVNLATGTATDGFGNTDTFTSVESVRGTKYADRLTGSDRLDTVEQFIGLQGNDTIDGAGGDDEIRYDNETSFADAPNAVFVNLAAGQARDAFGNTDTLLNIERVRGTPSGDIMIGSAARNLLRGLDGNDTLIGDGPLSLTAEAQSIRRLYIATLDRAPDEGGWTDWTTRRDGGTTLDAIAAGFVGSTEFQTKYGALNNTQFVTQLYRNVLDREPDTAGLANAVNALNSNSLTRTQIVTGFSESAEFIAGTSTTLHAGQVYRLYGATLGRAPDAGGFETWTDGLGGGGALVDIAAGFVNSSEFQAKYGALGNAGFVTLLYQNVLGRAPDAGGLAFWQGQLDSGTQTRTQVVTGFSESAEYINGTRVATDTFVRSIMLAWSDTLTGGIGDDRLTGGRGSDRFTFLASESGNDTIYGYDSFDTVQLTGFGFATVAQALESITQQGANAVLSFAGGSITFADTQVSALQGASLQGASIQGWVLG